MEAIGQLASGIAHEINTPTQYIGDNIRFFRDSFSGIAGLLHKYEAFFAAVEAGRPIEKLADEIRKETKEVDLEFLLKETPGAVERTMRFRMSLKRAQPRKAP